MKSSELNTANLLYENGSNFVSKLPQHGIRAMTVKQILRRLLQGEDIPDIEAEVRSLLTSNGAIFDTYIQQNDEVREYTNKINLYIDYFTYEKVSGNMNHIHFADSLTEEDYTEIEGKKVTPDFDYYYEGRDGIHITKVKTSKFKNPLTNKRDINDMYALACWAKEKFPNKVVYFNYDYLVDKDEKHPNYNYSNLHQQVEFEVTDDLFYKLEDGFNESMESGCNPDNCGTCGRNQLCNYEEPPMDMGTERTITPLSGIHLTQVQSEAKDFEEGVARVIAGAGAGKTLLVAMRVVELIKKGYDPSKIVMLTYTTTGAREMTDRVIRYLAGAEGILVDPSLVRSGTINSFGQSILNDHFEELGYTQAPVVCPEEVKYGIINEIFDSYSQIPEWKYRPLQFGFATAKFANKSAALNRAKQAFEDIKKNGWTMQDNGFGGSYCPQSIAMIFLMYEQYKATMKQKCFIDYDDQMDLVLQLNDQNPDLFNEYGFEHIIMDEYQDSNLKQLEIARALIGANSAKSFMGVGDDSQSIFGFQHATPEFIVNFGQYFGEFKDFQLLENHRSSRNIVNNANKINALVEDRVEKDLIATKDPGDSVEVKGFYTDEAEYGYVANDIKAKIEAGTDPSTICIMACTGDELRKFASALTKVGVPSVLMNPIPFRTNSRVAALCDYFDSFIHNTPKGMVEYENVLRHGGLKDASKEELDAIITDKKAEISNIPKTLTKFMEEAAKLDENKTDICYQDFLDRISYCRSMDELEEYFTNFELYGYDTTCSKTKEGHYAGVNIITVHSAKGLEWDTTYLSMDNFDNKKYHKSESKYSDEINEKRRLWFVGASRAKEKLICVGKYTLPKTNKDSIMQNTFLQKAFELQDLPYTYNTLEYLTAQREQTLANVEQEIER